MIYEIILFLLYSPAVAFVYFIFQRSLSTLAEEYRTRSFPSFQFRPSYKLLIGISHHVQTEP